MKNIVKMLAILMIASVASFAADLVNRCNANKSDGRIGVPTKSCSIENMSVYTLIVSGNAFEMDTFQSVEYNGKTFLLRLYVTNAKPEYNAIMAMAQNALATRSPLNIIYKNPAVNQVRVDALDNVSCAVNYNNDGTPAYMHCPIQAFSIPSQI